LPLSYYVNILSIAIFNSWDICSDFYGIQIYSLDIILSLFNMNNKNEMILKWHSDENPNITLGAFKIRFCQRKYHFFLLLIKCWTRILKDTLTESSFEIQSVSFLVTSNDSSLYYHCATFTIQNSKPKDIPS